MGKLFSILNKYLTDFYFLLFGLSSFGNLANCK